MTYATTFSGIGCWEVGLSACDWGLSWQCEKDKKCLRFLAERFGVPIHGDIRTLSESGFEEVDVLIGSPPCQPFSTSGKRGGTGDERHLYPSFLDSVRHFKPKWVLMEQVSAILSPERAKGKLVGPAPIGAYIGGLAALGYLGCYHCIPASTVGAPHRRDRIWIIAHAGHDAGCTKSIQQREIQAEEFGGLRTTRLDASASNALGDEVKWQRSEGFQSISSQCSALDSDADCSRKLQSEGSKQKQWRWPSYIREAISNTERLGRLPFGWRTRHPCKEFGNERGVRLDDGSCVSEQEAEDLANSYGAQREGDQREVREESQHANISKSNWWEVEPNVGRVANGTTSRVDRLKGLGNGLIPQIPALIGQAINSVETQTEKET